jgi:MFS family permease
MSAVAWLICIIASIGFAFDIYELLMLPLIVRPALQELVGKSVVPGSPEFQMWVGRLFFIPAFAGGVFGLLGGYLTDRLGRRRVLTWSILIYAFSAFAAGFSTSIWMLLAFRCTVFIGVCVEFVAAVAWLAELFPQRDQRERVLGYTQAFSSVGGLLVAFMNGLAAAWSQGKAADLLFGLQLPAMSLPAIPFPEWLTSLGTAGLTFDSHAAWRYTLMSGLIPAIPLILIRPFLPESPAWQSKKDAGMLHRPSLGELFSPQLARTTIITTLMFAFSFGGAFGAIQHIPQIVPGLPEARAEVKTRLESKQANQQIEKFLASPSVQQKLAGKTGQEREKVIEEESAKIRRQIKGGTEQEIAAHVTKWQEVGGLFGRFLLALLVVRVASQKTLIRLFQVPGLIVMPLVFGVVAVRNLDGLYYGMFLAGLLTVGQFSFWGNYLPRVYPIHLRGTGESFAANIGGRMLGTSFAWVTSNLAALEFMPGTAGPERLAYTAAMVGTGVYLAGLILSFFLPEPPAEITD